MEALFSSGRIVDIVFGVIALELIGGGLHRRITGRGVALGDLALNIAAGACLLLALRAALTGASWPWIAAALVASFAAHALDLSQRWRCASNARSGRERPVLLSTKSEKPL